MCVFHLKTIIFKNCNNDWFHVDINHNSNINNDNNNNDNNNNNKDNNNNLQIIPSEADNGPDSAVAGIIVRKAAY